MKNVPLIQSNKVAIIDNKDFLLVSQYKWSAYKTQSYNFFYARATTRINGKQFFMHRLLMGAKKDHEIDHINHDTLDNRRSNLRFVTKAQQQQNRKKIRGCTSKYKGVSWRKQRQMWEVYITINQKRKHLGYFNYEIEAAKAYDEAALKDFGEYAYLNKIS